MSRDPINEQGSANLYTYVDNSPLQYVDSLGLAAEWTVELDSAFLPDNPKELKDKQPGFNSYVQFKLWKPSGPTTQAWQLNERVTWLAYDKEGKCKDKFEVDYYLDTYDSSRSMDTIGLVDQQGLLTTDAQKKKLCFVAYRVKITIGFAPKTMISTPLTGDRSITKAEYEQHMTNLLKPMKEWRHFYVFQDRTRCPCCSWISDLRYESWEWSDLVGSPFETTW